MRMNLMSLATLAIAGATLWSVGRVAAQRQRRVSRSQPGDATSQSRVLNRWEGEGGALPASERQADEAAGGPALGSAGSRGPDLR